MENEKESSPAKLGRTQDPLKQGQLEDALLTGMNKVRALLGLEPKSKQEPPSRLGRAKSAFDPDSILPEGHFMRGAYAEWLREESGGDPKKERRLRRQVEQSPVMQDFFLNGPTSLGYSTPGSMDTPEDRESFRRRMFGEEKPQDK